MNQIKILLYIFIFIINWLYIILFLQDEINFVNYYFIWNSFFSIKNKKFDLIFVNYDVILWIKITTVYFCDHISILSFFENNIKLDNFIKLQNNFIFFQQKQSIYYYNFYFFINFWLFYLIFVKFFKKSIQFEKYQLIFILLKFIYYYNVYFFTIIVFIITRGYNVITHILVILQLFLFKKKRFYFINVKTHFFPFSVFFYKNKFLWFEFWFTLKIVKSIEEHFYNNIYIIYKSIKKKNFFDFLKKIDMFFFRKKNSIKFTNPKVNLFIYIIHLYWIIFSRKYFYLLDNLLKYFCKKMFLFFFFKKIFLNYTFYGKKIIIQKQTWQPLFKRLSYVGFFSKH